ncbi:unnamed protein product [Ambrosiozyma monospora]|uniref:Unnamed protein product n=1 Tax=Ambrosiozyma monospora TaxID=43982 RepID=A0A9W6Z345_AMBMO|nr:unnamed protein product [Ambrosiozyma monospora]
MSLQKKRTISYILSPNPGTSNGHHTLGVNALQYNSLTNSLISAGRDGLISIWTPNDDDTENPFAQQNHQGKSAVSDKNWSTSKGIKDYISDNLENEPEILNLESSIRSGSALTVKPSICSNYKLRQSHHLHLDWINDLKLIDGKTCTVASCSNDLSVRLWNVQTKSEATLGFHNDYVKCLAYPGSLSSSSGAANRILVSGGLDKAINVWDTNKTQLIQSYVFDHQDRGSVYSLAIDDQQDNLIVSGGPTNVISLFDRRSSARKPVKLLVGHTDNVRCLCIGDGLVLSGSSDSTVKLWDLRTTRILRNFDMHESAVWSLHVPTYENGGGQGNHKFDVFYSGDRSGLVMKTDLRACDLNDDVKKNDSGHGDNHNSNYLYLNDKVNKSLGISTLVADLNINYNAEPEINQGQGPEELNKFDTSDDNVPLKGCLSIIEGGGSLWTSNAVGSNDYISSWSIPNTDELVVFG